MTTGLASLARLERRIEKAARQQDAVGYYSGLREVLRLFEQVSRSRPDPEPGKSEKQYARLWERAGEALVQLGGQAQPTLATLDRYDHQRYGPMLGVSDEGSAAAAIRRGALASPKCAVLSKRTPLTVGVAHDAERLGAIGEVAVGPLEYSDIRRACLGRILTTTNVGTRVNLRNYLAPPAIKIKSGAVPAAVQAAGQELAKIFEPYWKTLTGRPRKCLVLVEFAAPIAAGRRVAILQGLNAALRSGQFCNPRVHRLGLLALVYGSARSKQVRAAIDLARRCGLDEVALDGPPLPAARELISLPGLLNLLAPSELNSLLAYACRRGVRLTTKQRVDPQTTARHIWTGLTVARNMGLELGKYGLLPLTFEEQQAVIARLRYFLRDWCAAPVCYLDYPLVTARKVYFGPSLVQGVRAWLAMVRRLGVRVVLIDTANKADGRRLLKTTAADEHGLLKLAEIKSLDAYARRLGLKTLWAGGISAAQTPVFGKLGVFGVYVTSAVTAKQRLGRRYRPDPRLTFEREPQPEAVARVKLLLEAGFLAGRCRTPQQAQPIEAAVEQVLQTLEAYTQATDERGRQQLAAKLKLRQDDLYRLAVGQWRRHFARRSRKP